MTPSEIAPGDSLLAIRQRYLGPSLLSPFADDIAQRLSRLSVGPLLETAADIGLCTQAIAATVSAGLTIVATDSNEITLRHACKRPGTSRVLWQIADPCALPFETATFGIVVCQFGIMALPDHVLAFREARRVMKPGGRFIFNVPANIRHSPVAACIQQSMQELFYADPPGYLVNTWHGYAENAVVDDDLTLAGFTDAVYATVDLPYAASSARDAAMGYCMGTPLRLEIEARAAGDSSQSVLAVAAALNRHFGTGPIETSMRAHVISASG